MNLQTKVDITQGAFTIGHTTCMLMLGSCFAENMGAKLQYYRFRIDINPCGIVYNPLSVAEVLRLLSNGQQLEGEDLLYNAEQWVSLMHHGDFSDPDKENCLEKINIRLKQSAEELKHVDVVLITFGTSWVYRYKKDGRIVANCHKLAADEFERFCLTVPDIVNEYMELIGHLRKINPNMKFLFTVSPIRHWKDGAHGNQLSKATLLLAIDELCRKLGDVYYFPSYEIVMDELRDYRFYADDMLHVSDMTVEYIWERFKDIYLQADTKGLMDRINKVNKTLMHRPSDENSPQWIDLLNKTRKESENINRIIAELY